MTLNVLQAFRGGYEALWATTYTFEPGLFDEFLFRRLGDPPLNVNILVDADRMGRIWEEWADQPWRLHRVNRDYLVRSVRWPGGAFHPKTLFFADRSGGVLLVGSGNLGLRGLIEGKEVFCQFSPETAVGRAAIASWRAWMARILVEIADPILAHRWQEMLRGSPWLGAPTSGSPFLHNLDLSILDLFTEGITTPVDELHVLAPFYDADAGALAKLLALTAPKTLHLYLPDGVSVSGDRLSEVVSGAPGEIRLWAFHDSAFVHAKLIGIVAGHRGMLLSGSPNCSRAALLSSARHGNCEVAILAPTTPDVVRSAFVPPSWSLVERRHEDLLGLKLRSHTARAQSWPVTLSSASRLPEGRIEVRFEPMIGSNVAGLVAGGVTIPISDGRTDELVAGEAAVGIVWLCDVEGVRLSNAVPVDDPRQLASWLAERAPSGERPRELRLEDVTTGVGELLTRLNRQCIFDIDETPSIAGVLRGSDMREGNEDEASGFWERFQADQLRLDYRLARYERLLASDTSRPWYIDDDVYGLLGAMLSRVPDHALRLVGHGSGDERPEVHAPPRPQLQVRVGNVLARWSKALDDRRFRWISPQVPVRNFVALLGAIGECWVQGYVGNERLSTITLTLLQSFVGSAKRRGYLLLLGDEERATAIEVLPPDVPEVMGALVYACLRPEREWRSRVYEWQPSLTMAIELGVVSAGPLTSEWVRRLPRRSAEGHREEGGPTDPRAIDDHLLRLATYIDDKHWCQLQAEELGFAKVALTTTEGTPAAHYPITIRVEGVLDLVVEPRIVSLVRRASSYKRAGGVIVEAGSAGAMRPQRVSVRTPGPIYATDGRSDFESSRDLER